MKTKTIKVDLLPEDFIDSNFISNDNCALARAARRHFKTEGAACGSDRLGIHKTKYIGSSYDAERQFEIVDVFGYDDYMMVKKAYEKDPKAKKAIYQVTLKEII